MEETWTILKVLQWTTGYFSRHGIEQPRANAEVLLAHVLGKERIELYLHFDQPLTSSELTRYRQLIQRRAAHEPTQYITQKQEFWSLEFEVNSSVLIPRPETELIVESAVDLIGNTRQKVLDLGTGSGAIAVSIAKECPAAEILATDASFDALQVAKRNAMRHDVPGRITFVAMDLFSGFARSRAAFDLVVTNPPYIGDEQFQDLAPEIESYEPQMALRGGGPKGLEIVRKILSEAPLYMKTAGVILLEIGHGQSEILQEELKENRYIEDVRITRDYSGIPRILHLRKANR
ncbi:MAG: peptide chain release factor N(5)-glutamine methyltransferase [Desulforhabdus sp.]|jgi:release factor glutamine methyltransferase|nr:peptide chain release factor N(5)-glutamine methyltransferase [Desulforhabdus sp.]